MLKALVGCFAVRNAIEFEGLDCAEIMRARYVLASIGESLTKASNDAERWIETLSNHVESEIISILKNGNKEKLGYDDWAIEVLVRKAVPQADSTFVSHVVLPRMVEDGIVTKAKARIDVDGTRTRTVHIYSLP